MTINTAKSPGGRPAAKRAVLRQLLSTAPPQGLTAIELAALAGERKSCTKQSLHKCVAAGRLFTVPAGKKTRYFLTAEARDAAAPHIAELQAAARARAQELRREAQRTYYARKCAARGTPVTPRTAQAAKPKTPRRRAAGKELLSRAVKPTRPAGRPSFLRAPDGPAITPPHVQVQHCPGYTGDRWHVKLPADGLVAEWRQLRAGA